MRYPGNPSKSRSFSDTALAAEVGLGARVHLGRLVIGLECALPVAFYSGEDLNDDGGLTLPPPMDLRDLRNASLHETIVDIEGLLTLGLEF